MFIDELVRRIDGRLHELGQEIAPLEQARAALNGSPPGRTDRRASPTAAAEPKPKRAPRKRQTRKRATSTASIALLAASDGLSTSALAEQSGSSQNQVLVRLKKLEHAGKVRRSGERRGTRWHVVTNEDRVAERAAELETRSGAAKPTAKPLQPALRKKQF